MDIIILIQDQLFSKYLEIINKEIEEGDYYKNIINKIESYDIKENVKKVIDNKITFDFTKDILKELVDLEATFLELIGFNNLGPLIGGDMKPSLTDLVPSEIKGIEPIILSIPKDANIREGKRIQIITESNPNPFVYELIFDNNRIRIIKDIIITLKDENKLEIEFKYFEEFENLRNENSKKKMILIKKLI